MPSSPSSSFDPSPSSSSEPDPPDPSSSSEPDPPDPSSSSEPDPPDPSSSSEPDPPDPSSSSEPDPPDPSSSSEPDPPDPSSSSEPDPPDPSSSSEPDPPDPSSSSEPDPPDPSSSSEPFDSSSSSEDLSSSSSSCPEIEVTTETFATQPFDRYRKKLGIGEEVTLTLTSPEDGNARWSIISGQGLLSPTFPVASPKSIVFKASGEEGIVVIEVDVTNYYNLSATIEFEVIAPKTVTFERTSGQINIVNQQNWQGITMLGYAYWHFGPDDVSFYNVEGGETHSDAHRTGWFVANALATGQSEAHPAWIGGAGGSLTKEVVSGKGTKSPSADMIQLNATQPPVTINQTGKFEWKMHWKYRLKGETGEGTPFGDEVIQWFEIYQLPPNSTGGLNGFMGRGGKGNITIP